MHVQRGDLDLKSIRFCPSDVGSRGSYREKCLRDRHLAFYQQFYPFLPDLYALLRRQSFQRCDKEDILQEILLRIWARSQDKEIVYHKSYFFRVARSVLIDRARRASVRQSKCHCTLEDGHDPVDPLDPGRIVLAREELTRLEDGLSKLPQRTRDIFVGARVEGKCVKAIAEDFGISVSAVEKHLSKALVSLAQHIRASDGAPSHQR